MARRNNGEGTIRYDRERKRWEARITVDIVDGVPVRKKLTAKTKDALLARLKDSATAVDAGLPAPTGARPSPGSSTAGSNISSTPNGRPRPSELRDMCALLHRPERRPGEAHRPHAPPRREDATRHPQGRQVGPHRSALTLRAPRRAPSCRTSRARRPQRGRARRTGQAGTPREDRR